MSNHFPSDKNELNSFDPNDLHWLAFCYVADELDPQQREAFELQLSDDQSARDAVANAVAEASLLNAAFHDRQTAVSQTIKKSVVKSSVDSPKNGRSIRRASLLAASAIVMLVVALIWIQTPATVTQPDGDQIAEIWSNEAWNSDDTFDSDSLGEFVMDESIDDTDRTEVTWLVAALEGTEEPSYDPHELDSPNTNEGGMPCF